MKLNTFVIQGLIFLGYSIGKFRGAEQFFYTPTWVDFTVSFAVLGLGIGIQFIEKKKRPSR